MTKIEKLQRWLLYTPVGKYVLRNERILFNDNVLKIFGYYSLQLGLKDINLLQGNKIANHYVLGNDIITNFENMPLASASIDLIVCSHVLDFSDNYQKVLQECYRVLIPNGKFLISGFNKTSLFTLFGKKQNILKESKIISLKKLKEDLTNLRFSIKSGSFFCYAPPVENNSTLRKLAWLEKVGNRWFPSLSANYFLVVEKNVISPTRILPQQSIIRSEELQLGAIGGSCSKNI